MRQALAAGLIWAGLIASAHAQQAAQPVTVERGALFITPMGEAFRSLDHDVAPIQVWVNTIDVDKDGKLSQQEYLADALLFFERLDTNHDVSLTSAEGTAYWQTRAPEILTGWSENPGFEGVRHSNANAGNDAQDAARRRERAQAAENRRLRGAALYGLLNNSEPIMTCDTNFDRRISRDEYMQCAALRFTLIDKNHDGFFEVSEGEEH
ncbi:MAG: EF-hand domain-containing protein [Pseudomonadota bacterium]